MRKIRRILGVFAWVVLAALLILINAAAADGNEIFASSQYARVFDSLIMKKVLLGLVKPIFFCQNFCFIL